MATQYANGQIVTNGLVLALNAADRNSYVSGSTTWNDISGNNNSGSLVNGPTFNSGSGGSIVFDGTNDYVSSPYLPSGTNPFTYNVWIYLSQNINGIFGGTNKGAYLFLGSAIGVMEITLLTDTNTAGPPDKLGLSRYAGGTTGTCFITVTGLIQIQKWYNISITHTGTSQVVYLNGVQIGTGNVSTNFVSGTSRIGGNIMDSSYSGYLAGSIASTYLYNRALSAQEILQNYNAQKSRFNL